MSEHVRGARVRDHAHGATSSARGRAARTEPRAQRAAVSRAAAARVPRRVRGARATRPAPRAPRPTRHAYVHFVLIKASITELNDLFYYIRKNKKRKETIIII